MMTVKETTHIPADTRLAEELAQDDVVEVANLTSAEILRRDRRRSDRRRQ